MTQRCQWQTHAPQQTAWPIGNPSTAQEQAYGNFNWCALELRRLAHLAPSSSGLIFNAKRAPAIANSGVPLDQGEGTLA